MRTWQWYTGDYGWDSLALGGEWKTNSASRVDELSSSRPPCYISATISQSRRLGVSPWWNVTAILSLVWLSTGRGGGLAGRSLWAFGRTPRRLEGTRRPLDANPTSEGQLTEHPLTSQPLSPTLVICRRCGLSSHSCKGIIPLTDPLGMEMWESRAKLMSSQRR